MLFLAACLPGGRAGQVADGLDDGALDGVVLTSGLGGDIICKVCTESEGEWRGIGEVRQTVAGVGDVGVGGHNGLGV